MIEDISYQTYKKSDDIHGTVLYPAVMVAPVQKDVMSDIMKAIDVKTVFDPFHGSGTSLYEALEIIPNVFLVGCDINPLANLITKVKLQGVSNSIYSDIEKLKLYLKREKEEPFTFNNIDKWFRKDIIDELTIIKGAISKIKNKNSRLYFWCMMCNIIRKYSNTRSSTYKLHIKQSEKINNMKNNVINDFIASVEKNVNKYNKSTKDVKLFKCDILEKIIEFQNNSFDVSITSPPYGENATTVPYGQFSTLALRWIDSHDLELDGWELENFSSIDSKSMGGTKSKEDLNEFELELLYPYISKINLKKRKKVLKFFADYFFFLSELCRVTKNYIVLTLGNRTVSGVNINLTDISMQFIEQNGFVKKQILMRSIPNKRIPKVTSQVTLEGETSPVSSMNDEYVIIARKSTQEWFSF